MTALLQERPAGIRNLRAREFRAILRTLAFDPEFLSFRASLEGRTPVELAQGGSPIEPIEGWRLALGATGFLLVDTKGQLPSRECTQFELARMLGNIPTPVEPQVLMGGLFALSRGYEVAGSSVTHVPQQEQPTTYRGYTLTQSM